jgi:hypothetical protein
LGCRQVSCHRCLYWLPRVIGITQFRSAYATNLTKCILEDLRNILCRFDQR